MFEVPESIVFKKIYNFYRHVIHSVTFAGVALQFPALIAYL